jgi:hypothetical protein
MIIPSGKSGTVGSSARITNDVIAFVDFSNDYGWAGNTANDLSNRSVKYSTPGGFISVVSGSNAEPGYIELDGGTDYLIAGSTLSDFATVTAITIDAWVKLDTISNRTIVSNNSTATGSAHRGFAVISIADGFGNWVPRVNVNTGVGSSSIASFTGLTASAGQWVNLFVVIRDIGVPASAMATDAKMFNPSGISASSFNLTTIGGSSHGLTSTNALAIGRRSTVATQYWDGSIGAVKIYNRALSENEMNLNYDRSKKRYGHS